MTTTNPGALLRRLASGLDEGDWLEFKLNNADCEMIGRTLSACANAAMLADRDRAYMVWGVQDKTLKRVGTDIKLAALKKGGENLTNWLSRMIEPKLHIEFLDFQDDGKQFSIITVEPTYDRPVRFFGQEYIRVGENIKSLKDFPEHERALWLATGRRKFEDAIALSNQPPDEVISLLDVNKYYQLKGEPVPKRSREILKRFAQLGFVIDDMEEGYHITNLGALLFANDIKAFPSIASKSVRVIKYSGVDKRSSEGETEGSRGYAIRFRGMLKFITDSLPKEETFQGGVRKGQSLFSEIAIREIVANALIHQDFTITGTGPVIEIYNNRIEVTNPGHSLITVDRIIDERRSRNEKFAGAMRELGICEERGGGIDKAIIELEEMALPAPEFSPSEHSMRVVLFGPKAFNQLSKADKVWCCFCHCVVSWLRHDYMSNTSLRDRFSLEPTDYQAVSSVISDARKAGRIVPAEKNQGNRNARYVPFWAAKDDE